MIVGSRYPLPGFAGQAQLARDQAIATEKQAEVVADTISNGVAAAQAGAKAASDAANQAASTLQSMLTHDFTGPEGPVPLAVLSAWAPNAPYVVGPPASFVAYQGSSYACAVSHTSSGVFDPTKWIVVAQKGNDGSNGSIDLETFPSGALLKATPNGLVPAVAGSDYIAPSAITIFDAGTA